MTAPMTTRDLQARVALGVAWLDEHDPGWWRTDLPDGGPDEPRPIDLDELSMKDPCRCIFGHRLGNYYRLRIPLEDAVARGFDTAAGHHNAVNAWNYEEWQAAVDDEFDALTELWSRVIEQRRADAT